MPLLPSSDFADLSPRGVSDGHPLHHRSWEFGLTPLFLKAVIFGMVMIVVIFTDLNERIIPHSVTLPGATLGIILSLFIPVNDSLFEWIFRHFDLALAGRLSSFIGSVTGGIFGAGLLYAVAWLFR